MCQILSELYEFYRTFYKNIAELQCNETIDKRPE